MLTLLILYLKIIRYESIYVIFLINNFYLGSTRNERF